MQERDDVEVTEQISLTDNSYDVLLKLEKLVKAIGMKDETVRKFYIGIASGPDYDFALRRRYDEKKRKWEIVEMIAIFQTRHQPLCRYAEGCLEQYFRNNHPDRIFNETGGGGGRNSNQPWHFIYVAVARLGKQKSAG